MKDVAAEVEVSAPNDAGALPDPPAPPPAPPPLPGLAPLGDAEVAEAIGSGASCALVSSGRPLMVAMVGQAVAKDQGRIVRLEPAAEDWNALTEGGRFVAEGLAIEVDPGPVLRRGTGLVERDSSVSVMRGRLGFGVSHGPVWACGS